MKNYTRFGVDLYGMLTARLNLKVRLLKTDLIKTLLYGRVTWTLNMTHLNELRKAHLEALRRVLGFQRRAHHTNLSYAKGHNKTKCESDHPEIEELFFPLAMGFPGV